MQNENAKQLAVGSIQRAVGGSVNGRGWIVNGFGKALMADEGRWVSVSVG